MITSFNCILSFHKVLKCTNISTIQESLTGCHFFFLRLNSRDSLILKLVII